MKTLIYLWLILAAVLLASCSDNNIPSYSEKEMEGNETAIISISSKQLLPVDMNKSRAGMDKFLSHVNDLNIRVHLKDGKHIDFYCDNMKITSTTPLPKKNNTFYTAEYLQNHKLSDIQNGNKEGTRIHCNNIVASQIKKIEVIANYGQQIHHETMYSSIKELESSNYLSKNYCMMYGLGTIPATLENTHLPNGTKCKLFEVQLKRTRAMISVKINNLKLNPGVEITPKKIRLCNVPTSCKLSNLALVSNKITSSNECVRVSQEREIKEGLLKTSIGVHAEDNNIPANFRPFYMYENMQGTYDNAGNEVTKYPEGISSVSDAKNPSKNFKYSYIEIVAGYKYMESGTVKVAGDIIYRFFLGNNATNNFDIEGSHYYKLTLNLKGFGGAKEDGKIDNKGNLVVNNNDASWRVDMNTRDWGFEKSEYDIDSHDVIGTINAIGKDWIVESVNGATSWLEFKTDDSGTGWTEPVIGSKFPVGENGKVTYHAQSLFYSHNNIASGAFNEETYNQKINYREITVTLKKSNDKQVVTFRQYAPIPIKNGKNETVFMERFEDLEEFNYVYPWEWKDNDLREPQTFPQTFQKYKFIYGNSLSTKELADNTVYLSERIINEKKEGEDGAANQCYLKGINKGRTGGDPGGYYVLPDEITLKNISKINFESIIGPCEPFYKYEDYWTSTVEETNSTSTKYWDGNASVFKSTNDRKAKKRIRTIFVPTVYL